MGCENMDEKNLKKQITKGVILIIIGISLFMKDYVAEKREEVFNSMNLELTELLAHNDNITDDIIDAPSTEGGSNTEEVGSLEEQDNNPPPAQIAPQEPPKQYETYVGVLEIPKINFNKGFYKKESSLNNVKYNLKILPQSSYPDEDKGNVIIIGHSGNYNNSYFRNLYQLEINDTAIIKYNNKIYTYKIVNIYTDTKDGTVTIYRDETKNCLTLITCTKDDDTKQTIYIFELVSIE